MAKTLGDLRIFLIALAISVILQPVLFWLLVWAIILFSGGHPNCGTFDYASPCQNVQEYLNLEMQSFKEYFTGGGIFGWGELLFGVCITTFLVILIWAIGVAIFRHTKVKKQ